MSSHFETDAGATDAACINHLIENTADRSYRRACLPALESLLFQKYTIAARERPKSEIDNFLRSKRSRKSSKKVLIFAGDRGDAQCHLGVCLQHIGHKKAGLLQALGDTSMAPTTPARFSRPQARCWARAHIPPGDSRTRPPSRRTYALCGRAGTAHSPTARPA